MTGRAHHPLDKITRITPSMRWLSMAGSPRSSRTGLPVLAVSLVAVGRLGLLINLDRAGDPVGVAVLPDVFQPHAGAYGVGAVEDLAAGACFEVHVEPLANARMGSQVLPSRWLRGGCWQGWLIADLRGRTHQRRSVDQGWG